MVDFTDIVEKSIHLAEMDITQAFKRWNYLQDKFCYTFLINSLELIQTICVKLCKTLTQKSLTVQYSLSGRKPDFWNKLPTHNLATIIYTT